MIASLLALFAFTTAFALVGPAIARRVSPALATRLSADEDDLGDGRLYPGRRGDGTWSCAGT